MPHTAYSPSQFRETTMRILPMRDDCLLVELADLDEVLALLEALDADPVAGIRQIVPAARTLMIAYEPALISDRSLAEALLARGGGKSTASTGALVEIPVLYDGEDLAEVAGLLNMSADEVVRRHVESDYVVAFTGFAPGFAYLANGDLRLTVPRRTSPRTHVPAGAVGLAGAFSGVYPKASPGGWQLIGRTPLAMFDIGREPASLLQPGNRVRFRNAADAPAHEVIAAPSRRRVPTAAPLAIEVLSTGLPVLFQDLGRAGQAGQGIGLSGAADHASLKAANRLVGNAPDRAVLEIALGGLRFRMHGHGVMALAGAAAPITITDANGTFLNAAHAAAIALNDGDTVLLGMPAAGMRSYLAMRGGFEVEPVLGSASTDTLAQIGPAALAAGDRIGLLPVQGAGVVSLSEIPAFAMPKTGETVVLDVVLGPRTDWFKPDALASFLAQDWAVTPQSSRVGIRLAGDALERDNMSELPSEATLRGAIQVPASGQPVLFLADHPLTGGYPVIAVVASHHLDLSGQIPVGARIRFQALGPFSPRIISGKQS